MVEVGFRDRARERYFNIYHYDIFKDGLGAMLSGVYPVRLCINTLCFSLE